MDHSVKFEPVQIPLLERIRGLDAVSGVIGIPEWWPTGERVAMVLGHAAGTNFDDPLLVHLQRVLTQNQILTIRFNFPFAEKSRRARPDSIESLELAYRCALSMLGRDSTAMPAHLFLGGFGIGARVAARLASDRLPVDGLALFSYPLHPKGKPKDLQPDGLYRVVAPMLFVHGSEDPSCKPEALRRCLSRIGAPVTAYSIEGAGAELFSPDMIPPPPEPSEKDLRTLSDDDFKMAPPSAPEGPVDRFTHDVVAWVHGILGPELS